jgi:hypothetical protein
MARLTATPKLVLYIFLATCLVGCKPELSAKGENPSDVPGCDSGGVGTDNNPNCSAENPTPQLMWTRQFSMFNGFSSDNRIHMLAIDSESNSISVGYSFTSFDGGPAAQNAPDAFIIKYDQDGNKLWSRQFGTSGPNHNTALDSATSVAVDGSNNIYVAGYTAGSLDGTSAGNVDIFLRKYDPDGALLLAKQYGTSGADVANGIAIDDFGNIYLAGSTTGYWVPKPVTPYDDGLLIKISSSGTLIWVKQFSSQYIHSYVIDVRVDHGNNVIIVSPFGVSKFAGDGNLIWETGPESHGVAVATNDDIFVTGGGLISKYDSFGVLKWSSLALESHQFSRVTLDSDDNPITCGIISWANPDPNGEWGVSVSKFSNDGNYEWSYAKGKSSYVGCRGIAANSENEIFVSGGAGGAVSFDGNPNQGVESGFVLKLETSGNY